MNALMLFATAAIGQILVTEDTCVSEQVADHYQWTDKTGKVLGLERRVQIPAGCDQVTLRTKTLRDGGFVDASYTVEICKPDRVSYGETYVLFLIEGTEQRKRIMKFAEQASLHGLRYATRIQDINFVSAEDFKVHEIDGGHFPRAAVIHSKVRAKRKWFMINPDSHPSRFVSMVHARPESVLSEAVPYNHAVDDCRRSGVSYPVIFYRGDGTYRQRAAEFVEMLIDEGWNGDFVCVNSANMPRSFNAHFRAEQGCKLTMIRREGAHVRAGGTINLPDTMGEFTAYFNHNCKRHTIPEAVVAAGTSTKRVQSGYGSREVITESEVYRRAKLRNYNFRLSCGEFG